MAITEVFCPISVFYLEAIHQCILLQIIQTAEFAIFSPANVFHYTVLNHYSQCTLYHITLQHYYIIAHH